MRALVAGVVLLVAAGAAQAAERPTAQVDSSGVLAISLDPRLLREAEKEKHLTSGLTTTFIIRAEQQSGGVRVDIRYEPWDELYYVRSYRGDGRAEVATIRSRAELETWWTTPRFLLTRGVQPGVTLKLIAEVIPFSASEEADAKRWLAHSLGSAPPPAAVATFGPPSLFSAVIGSSVRRRPVVKLSWQVRTQKAP
jgi:hypothetical protein